MSDGPKSLDDLRAEIDRLDEAMHDLLMRRTVISRQMAGAKGAAPSMRPAREMEILRRLAARHRGDMPLAGVVRIWREIMAASLALQAGFTVYLLGGEDAHGLWDLARFHFGSGTRLAPLSTAAHVVQELDEGGTDIGVLPEPLLEEDEPWWPHLLFAGPDGPRVIARLPFLVNAPGYDFPPAYALANLSQRATGDDATLIVLLTGEGFSRGKAAGLFQAEGIKARLIALAPEKGGGERRYMLFETDTFVAEDDPRLESVANADEGILQIKVVGGYARPIDGAALGAGPAHE